MKFKIKEKYTGKLLFTAVTRDGGLDLQGADLQRADLQRADLRGADLRYADLQDADLRGADLRYANLRGADLRYADLQDADLQDANLNGVHGVNDWVKCIQIDTYPITYTSECIQIGCQRHTHDEWRDFSDIEILEMDGRKAVKWWRKWKHWIFTTIEMCPAKPTKDAAL